MLAVSNTSPISNLASIGRLNLLPAQFETVWIPEAVANELSEHPDDAAILQIQSAFDAGWLQRQPIEDCVTLAMLQSQLHRGEAEAIALALSKSAGKILIDEKEGRRIAIQCGLSVTGVVGILLGAKKLGQIDQIRPEIEKLRSQAGFYVAPALVSKVLSMAGED